MSDETTNTVNRATDPLPRLVIDETAKDRSSRIWYALPGSFIEIPISAMDPAPGSPEEAYLSQAMGVVLDAVPEPTHETYVGALNDVRVMSRYMRREGIIACCLGMHAEDDGSPSLAVFTVSLSAIEWTPAKITAARAILDRDNIENMGFLTLPGGHPASVTDTVVSQLSAGGIDPEDVYQCNLYVPDPAGTQLATLTLTSTSVSSRRHYRELMEGIAPTVAFQDPLPDIERTARKIADAKSGQSAQKDIADDFG
jgi:hypothetical protein